MPRKKNSPARTLIPLAVLLVGVGIAILIAQSGSKKPSPGPASPDSIAQTAPEPADAATLSPPEQGEPDEPASVPTPADTPAEPLPGLHARPLDTPVDLGFIGSLDPDSGYELEANISPLGAGLASLSLTNHYTTLERTEHVTIQEEQEVRIGASVATAVPFALTAVIVNGERVDLTSGPNGEQVWGLRKGGRVGELEAVIVDEHDTPVLRIERTIALEPGSHDIAITQRAVNLTDRDLQIRWIHSGPMSFQSDTGGYGGDKRRARFGYWLDPKAQASDPAVSSNELVMPMQTLVGVEKNSAGVPFIPVSKQIWPNRLSEKKGLRPVWFGITGRYFGVAVHPLADPNSTNKVMPVESISRFAGVTPDTPAGTSRRDLLKNAVVIALLESKLMDVPAGASASFNLGAYTGPLSRSAINEEPIAKSMGLDGLVLYNFGGMCAWCTFQPLAHLLLAILKFLDALTGDWGIAIIILVIIVRTCLHPITRWSQIRLQRFGAQMQAIAPKMQKLKEKYGDDKQKLQQETTKLWKEEGVNPAGALGCLPMFLQSPVWIALYATLYFAVELRHQPAFYGVFQKFGGWPFLADLSQSDNAIPLGTGFSVFGLAHIDSINLLPILLGLVFYFHQKFLTPPSTATMTPEQESTQKMVKVMTVVMFPLIMYAAPSGLSLYFITNSTLAIVENKWIRAHMNKHGLLDPDKIREQAKARRQSGYLARLQQLAAQQQERQQTSKRMMRRVKNVAPDRRDPKYKKRK
ncbi:MAG: membrane protein insertase YidC [Planctomycetota bacterium]|nr:MAG: membrane protein insertase YidC [Planctomycetota bacterium]